MLRPSVGPPATTDPKTEASTEPYDSVRSAIRQVDEDMAHSNSDYLSKHLEKIGQHSLIVRFLAESKSFCRFENAKKC